MKAEPHRPIFLKDYEPPPFLIDTVNLDIRLHTKKTRVKSQLAVRPNPQVNRAPKTFDLDGEYLELNKVSLDGVELAPAAYILSDSGMKIRKPPRQPFTLEIETTIDPSANTALQGLYVSRGVYCTQCEAQGFRRITYFPDRPDVLSVYTVRLEADAKTAPVLLSNGNLSAAGAAGSGRHFTFWHDPFPKPCYLFAAVGGDLTAIASSFKTMSGRRVELRIYVEHGKDQRAHWAMESLKRAFAWDERRFGREYDLDIFNIVAVSDFNMGAMENKGLNVFNDRLILASPETATDANFEAIESVVAHEYFHNWTGNRITCRDWFQLCLKEGLTVYRDQEFSSDERSRTVQRIADVRQLKALQFPEDQGPLAHPVRPESYIEINNFYTATVYEKGAELVRMIEGIIGRDKFRAGMDLYFARHDGEAATIEDFILCFEDASGQSLAQFKRWYAQSGTPHLDCEFAYDKAKKTAELKIRQVSKATRAEPVKEPLFIPLKLGFIGANGHDIAFKVTKGTLLHGNTLAVSKKSQTFEFSGVTSRPVPSLLRGFSAPVSVSIDLSDDDLAFQMTHDADLFNRWQAANIFATRSILSLLAAKKPSSAAGPAKKFARAISAALQSSELEDAYKAELLKLPSVLDLARDKGANVDHAKIFQVHRDFSAACAAFLAPDLEDAYRTSSTKKPYAPDAAGNGRRALRNAALTLLTSRGSADDLARLLHHYETASNMTDAAAALFLIAATGMPERQSVIDDFSNRWKHDHLVIDMWFAAQAQSPLSDTLARVKALVKHPLFKVTTPNKVRALIGTFSLANPVQFNAASGDGYAFLRDTCLDVDLVNPQISARLLSAFRSYRTLEPKRRALARAAIAAVEGTRGISRDLKEIASRMLEG